jgi:reactive intermediate/imine deaminase
LYIFEEVSLFKTHDESLKLPFFGLSFNEGEKMKQIIGTSHAPRAIGTYSQAVKVANTVYISGQIPLDPNTMELISEEIEPQIHQAFKNLENIATAAGGQLTDVVKVSIYLTDLNHFTSVNEIMSQYFKEPYPARAVVEVSKLPKQSKVEMDAIMVLFD